MKSPCQQGCLLGLGTHAYHHLVQAESTEGTHPLQFTHTQNHINYEANLLLSLSHAYVQSMAMAAQMIEICIMIKL